MGLPSRPDCVVRIPQTLFVGETATMHVELTTARATKVDFIDVRLRGRQGWFMGTGSSAASYMTDLPSLGKRVMGAGELAAGTRTFPLSFTLPRGAAPTHDLQTIQSRFLIDVHVSIPWWPDGKYSFTAPVRLPPPDDITRTPIVVRQPFTPKPGEPRMEVSLASTTLVAGETLVGSCALFHMSDKDRAVEVAFEPRVKLLGYSRAYEHWSSGLRSSITIPKGAAGEAVPFRIRLPDQMTPTFKTASHEVEWFMKLTVGSMISGKISMRFPITIVDARARESLGALTLAPRVADQRVVAAFERFAAAHGMSVLTSEETRYPDEQPALVREVGDSTIRIGYAYRGEAGTFLVGRVTYPHLGLGLSVTPSSTLRELLSKDIEVDVEAWDRAHHVDARDADQTVPFLRTVIPTARAGNIVRWTDDELVTERSIGTVEEGELESLAVALAAATTAITSSRAIIQPPAGITADVAGWQSLAERLTGHFTVGDLSIRSGVLDLEPVEIHTVFDEDGRAASLEVAVGSPGADVELTGRAQELLDALQKDLPSAVLRAGVVTAAVDLADAGDATRVRNVVLALRGFIASLNATMGPYR